MLIRGMVHDQVQDHRDTAAVCAVDGLPCLRLPRTGRDDDPAQVPPNQVRCVDAVEVSDSG
jgi:hypothetical protein